jgi:hypothetical protein
MYAIAMPAAPEPQTLWDAEWWGHKPAIQSRRAVTARADRLQGDRLQVGCSFFVPRPASRRLGCEFGRVAGDWRRTGAASGAVRADGGEDGVPDWGNHFRGFCGKWRTAQNSPPGFCAARTYRWSFYSARSASGRRLRPSIGAYWFKFSKNWRTARAKAASEQHLPSHLQFSTTISDCIRMYISYLWPL